MATEKAARHERPEALGSERVKVDEQDSRLLDAMMDADMPRERIRKRLNSTREMGASIGEHVALTEHDRSIGEAIHGGSNGTLREQATSR